MSEAAGNGGWVLREARAVDLQALVDIDDAASTLYARQGIDLALRADHPLVLAERDRWALSIAVRAAFLAESAGAPVGFVALQLLDGMPYLDQVSVRPSHGRRGLGRLLVQRARTWAEAQDKRELWLTTYDHVPWNAPFYARLGFEVVAPLEHGPELAAVLASQRGVLPAPEHRVAMRLRWPL